MLRDNSEVHSPVKISYSPNLPCDYAPMRQYGAKLAESGWSIIPLVPCEKRPLPSLSGQNAWSRRSGPPTPIETAHWLNEEPSAGIGIVCAGLCVIDVDYPDEALANEIGRLLFDVVGATPLISIGNYPKRKFIYRTDDHIGSRSVCATNIGGVSASIDILAATGDGSWRQFVAFGVHPITGNQYQWDDKSPLDYGPTALPTISAPAVDNFVQVVGDYLAANKETLGNRNIALGKAPAARGSTKARREPLLDGITLKRVPYDQLPIRPIDALEKDMLSACRAIKDHNRHRYEDINSASYRAGQWLETHRYQAADGAVLDKADVESDLKSAIYNAVKEAIDAAPDGWRISGRGRNCAQGIIEDGLTDGRRDGEQEAAEIAYLAPIGEGMKAWFQRIGGTSAGSAASAAQQQSVSPPSTSTAAWTDRNGNAHASLRPAGAVLLPTPAMPAAQLHQQAADGLAGFFQMGDAFHAHKAGGIPPNEPVRYLSLEAAGAGKTTAYVNSMAGLYGDGAEQRNNLYVAPNHRIAKQTRAALRKAGLTNVALLEGGEKLCTEPDRKVLISRLSAKGLPFSEVCDTCPSRATCKYQAQFEPRSRSIVIAQQAHIALGRVPGIDHENAAPLFATVIDESILQAMMRSTRGSVSLLSRTIRLPKPKATRKESDEEIARRRAQCLLITNWGRAQLARSISRTVIARARHAPQSVNLCNRDDFVWFYLRTAYDGRTRAEWVLDEAVETRRLLMAETLKVARAKRGASLDIRSSVAAQLRTVDHIINILHVLIANTASPHDYIAGLEVVATWARKRSAPSLELKADYLLPLPARIRAAPIAMLDATGSLPVFEALVRERRTNANRWRVSSGEAERPNATLIKVVGAPVKAGQLLAGAPQAKKPDAKKGRVEINGRAFEGGDVVPVGNAAPPGWLDGLRSDASAKIVERWLMARVEEEKRAGAQRIAIFTTKAFAAELKLRKWTAGIAIDHLGNLAGTNDFSEFDVIVQVGQLRPRLDAIRAVTAALSAAHPSCPKFGLPRYERAYRPITIGGKPFELEVPSFRLPFARVAQSQTQDAHSIQAWGRLRAHHRTAQNPCKLIVLDEVAEGAWDEAEVFKEIDELNVFQIKHGRLPANDAEAAALEPELFLTPQAARMVRRRKAPTGAKVSGSAPSGLAPNSYPQAALPLSTYEGLDRDPDKQCSVSGTMTVTHDTRSALSQVTADDYAAAEAATGGKPAAMARWLLEHTGVQVTRQAIYRHRKAIAKASTHGAEHADREKANQKPQEPPEQSGVVRERSTPRKPLLGFLASGNDAVTRGARQQPSAMQRSPPNSDLFG